MWSQKLPNDVQLVVIYKAEGLGKLEIQYIHLRYFSKIVLSNLLIMMSSLLYEKKILAESLYYFDKNVFLVVFHSLFYGFKNTGFAILFVVFQKTIF